MRVYVEVIPRKVVDVVRKPFNHISERGGTVNDSIGYETLHDTIVVAEDISASLLRNVEPENLLFIFGQTIQAIGYALIEAPLTPPTFNDGNPVSTNQKVNRDTLTSKVSPSTERLSCASSNTPISFRNSSLAKRRMAAMTPSAIR